MSALLTETAQVFHRTKVCVFMAIAMGLIAGFPRTRHSIITMVIGKDGEQMQRDSAYTVARDQAGLNDAAAVGLEAAAETLAESNSQKLGTMKVPVIFRADIANSLFGHLVSAIGGGALYW